MKTARRALLLLGAASTIFVASAVPAEAAYPFKCPKQRVLVVEYDTGAVSEHGTIQAAVDTANGTPAGSSVGDTVVVCPGTYGENVSVPLMDSGGANDNLTIRSWSGPADTKVVGAATGPVFDVDANGVTLGGPGLGLTITGSAPVGVQVGDPMEPDPTEDDDQEVPECVIGPPPECPDEELPALTPINVTVVGNRVVDLAAASGTVAGISVTNSNNTLTFRNLVDGITAGSGGRAFGIRYSDTNSNIEVLENAVTDISQTGGGCSGSLQVPDTAAIGVAVQEEALDALVHDTKIEHIDSSCVAIGTYSDAWGGLENDRNGQQIPIVTDLVDNRIKDVVATDSAGVVIAPAPLDTEDDESAPSSFRVLANDIDDTEIAVAVLAQMAPNSYIRENDFDHDQIGVLNDGDLNLDATNNWWGCAEGPASGKKECATAVGPVFFNPWLKQHVDHAGDHAGEHAGHS